MPPAALSNSIGSRLHHISPLIQSSRGIMRIQCQGHKDDLIVLFCRCYSPTFSGSRGGGSGPLIYQAVIPTTPPSSPEYLFDGGRISPSFQCRNKMAQSIQMMIMILEVSDDALIHVLLAWCPEELVRAVPFSRSGLCAAAENLLCPPENRTRKILTTFFTSLISTTFICNYRAKLCSIFTTMMLMIMGRISARFGCKMTSSEVKIPSSKILIKVFISDGSVFKNPEKIDSYVSISRVKDWLFRRILECHSQERIGSWNLDGAFLREHLSKLLPARPTMFGSAASSPYPSWNGDTSSNILEADEEAQLEAAIKASLDEGQKQDLSKKFEEEVQDSENDNDNLDTFDSDSDDVDYSLADKTNVETTEVDYSLAKKCSTDSTDSKELDCEKKIQPKIGNQIKENNCESNSAPKSDNNNDEWKSYLGKESDPVSKLMLRLPDGSRDIVSMPCTSKLMALVKYVSCKGFSNESYEMVTNFPRRQISYMDFDISLKDAGLFPQESIFIQAR
ncbi:unnamed protein product, partial [Meganyctiphanes norvegica]